MRTITADVVFGHEPVLAEFGQPVIGLPMNGSAQLAPATAAPGPARFFGGGFWRSSDFGLLIFGLGLLYFDLRLINR